MLHSCRVTVLQHGHAPTAGYRGKRDRFIPAKTKVREGRFVGASAVQDRGPFFPLWEPCQARRSCNWFSGSWPLSSVETLA
jgi:hypothetical protein